MGEGDKDSDVRSLRAVGVLRDVDGVETSLSASWMTHRPELASELSLLYPCEGVASDTPQGKSVASEQFWLAFSISISTSG